MPLDHGYGVLIGTIQNYYRDEPDDYGKYYHGNLIVHAPEGDYHCAIDVDSKHQDTGVEWKTIALRKSELDNLLAMGEGYHPLVSNSTSGALDYIRSPMFAARMGCLAIIERIFRRRPLDISRTWKKGTDVEALSDLEPLVSVSQNNNLRVLVFGEPFHYGGLGVHNIHQNQGDPLGFDWSAENGIWQDGCTILQQDSDTFVAFMSKFSTQSYETDVYGHPV